MYVIVNNFSGCLSVRRKSEFERKKSAFLSERSFEIEEPAPVLPAGTRRVADRIRLFSGTSSISEDESELEKRKEEEERKRMEEFQAKRGVFSH
jgi:hypothetical protein